MQELLDYLDIEVIEKEKFIELNFIKMEEEFDETLFDKDELRTINKVVNEYKETSSKKYSKRLF